MPDKFLIQGGIPLKGEVEISGYKNSAGAVLAAVLLSEESSTIDNLPQVTDVLDQIEILKQMGAEIEWLNEKKIKINPKNINPEKIPADLFEKMRVSVLLIGPLLARFKKFKVPHPGGDKIGLRPISTHLEALKDFGAEVEEKDGFYYFKAPENPEGKRIVLKEFSVTATENAMMFAALCKGKTKIEIAAAEPQVQDTGKILKEMGAKIEGIGTHTIEIDGQEKLHGVDFSICPDLLEAGTYFLALALTGGEGRIKNVNPDHLTFFLEKMKEIGVNFEVSDSEISVKPSGEFKATKIQVLPYPGFPTDLQPQTSVLLTQAQGKSLIHDPLYENRFQYLHELRKMGADIEITDPHRALIFGKKELIGNKVNSTDIRSGAALILAGLVSKERTLIENTSQIERGYEKIEEKLRKLGAKIERV
ncbi:MAG: UDP-N-acetylglucosamine 1-carboxyvinyltransferase [Candidatus Nealsonbacteria bacterium CG23_combo_of_CG06-09_8_20_14_all_39_25]|uniref:UDP-N-acetylglucosamine 1-carboxyvinyltransferase n=4 Tax=Candidatus Nealsoniibacteriota TaxID=1817911 RepID=A0A2G9YS35_9BACT|nr:MAG: UDP-N-acetylglucosamine 1-carboxyvinyltransferase [Candidatus Nealsonbacteria bacterium CG23_combo_of_CG06-09_8_20_14_all_39_25]PIQ98530.1 MAG: UDP-N-acetylglucosamine 1-carboxyvinyltransferase [Candidatus Nealsonbacteria bacterium CG11_big_fil_rev_8_21_14_0_20_39_9]PIW90679.1 MAG: UDP-N-acetylglucosamine 1-carboxyvinyltransferase [Candidatus Nealsonbacteria bacterium CG_4_8_14_3_um_filter_40_11]PIZ88345.1 MAG: UDP-N-acetylglucosamine 1-carboxyvinyltransferase [Candidatus Nealsonbacteria